MWTMTFKSYDGNTLPTADYAASFAGKENRLFQAASSVNLIKRGFRSPTYGAQQRNERHLTLMVKVIDTVNIKTLTDTLINVFDTSEDATAKLLVTDSAAADWYVQAKVVNHVVEGGIHHITLMAPDGVWIADTLTTASTWQVTASGQTNVFTPGGNHKTKPTITITPQLARSADGLVYRKFVAMYNQKRRSLSNYPIELSDGGWDTATLVSASKMQADGDDLRVFVDGKRVPRWLDSINSASTKVWINIDLQPKIELITKGALGAGGITQIDFKKNLTTREALAKLPDEGTLLIDGEMFSYTAVSVKGHKVKGVTRAILDTTAATHVDASTCRWIEHVISVGYGRSTLSAPVQNEEKEPIIDQNLSTNTSWVYTDKFGDLGDYDESSRKRRSGNWVPRIIRSTGGESVNYTGNRGANVSPWITMGAQANVWDQGDSTRSEKYIIDWYWHSGAGVTTISMDGEKFRTTANWPAKAIAQVSKQGTEWEDAANFATISTPASASTWAAWSDNGNALGATYRHIRFRVRGKLSGTDGNQIAVEVENVTLALDSSHVPIISFGAENASTYQIDLTLKNTTTGEEFSVDYLVKLLESIEIDCESKTAKSSEDNANIFAALRIPPQDEWLTLNPGANTIEYNEDSVVDVDVVFNWRDRDGGL